MSSERTPWRAIAASGLVLALGLGMTAAGQAVAQARVPSPVAAQETGTPLPIDCPTVPNWNFWYLKNDVYTPGNRSSVECWYSNVSENRVVEAIFYYRGAQPFVPPFTCGAQGTPSNDSWLHEWRSDQWLWGQASLDPPSEPNPGAPTASVQAALNSLMAQVSPYAELCPSATTQPPTTATPTTAPPTTAPPTTAPPTTAPPTTAPPTTVPPTQPPFHWMTGLSLSASRARINTKVTIVASFQPASKSSGRKVLIQIKWPGLSWHTAGSGYLGSDGRWNGWLTSRQRGPLSVRVTMAASGGLPAIATSAKVIRWY